MFPQSSERRSHKHLVWSDTGSKCQWIGLPNAASRSTLGPSLALGNIDLIQHSSRKHVLGDCIMFFAGNLVHGLKDEFESIHGLPPWCRSSQHPPILFVGTQAAKMQPTSMHSAIV